MATPITRALYEALLAEQEVYSKQIEAIQQEIARVNQDILLFKNTIADSPALISQNQAAQDTNQKLQADTNTAIADKQNQISIAKDENAKLNDELKALEDELAEATAKNDQAEINRLTPLVAAKKAERDAKELEIFNLTNEVEALAKVLDQAKNDLVALKETGENLADDLKEANDLLPEAEASLANSQNELSKVLADYAKWSSDNLDSLRLYQAQLEVREKNYVRVNLNAAINRVQNNVTDQNRIAENDVINDEIIAEQFTNLTDSETQAKAKGLDDGKELTGYINAENAAILTKSYIWSFEEFFVPIKEAAEKGDTNIMVRNLKVTTALALQDSGYKLYLQGRTPINSASIKGGRFATDVVISWAFMKGPEA